MKGRKTDDRRGFRKEGVKEVKGRKTDDRDGDI